MAKKFGWLIMEEFYEDEFELLKIENQRLKEELFYVHKQLGDHCECKDRICICDFTENKVLNLNEVLDEILKKIAG